jgi:hypothetical protein
MRSSPRDGEEDDAVAVVAWRWRAHRAWMKARERGHGRAHTEEGEAGRRNEIRVAG